MKASPIESFKALAHPLRYKILRTLADGEHNVGEIEEASGIGQPALSQQLAILRKAGLVSTRREAKQVYYAITHEAMTATRDAIADLVPADNGAQGGEAGSSPHANRTGAAVFARLNI